MTPTATAAVTLAERLSQVTPDTPSDVRRSLVAQARRMRRTDLLPTWMHPQPCPQPMMRPCAKDASEVFDSEQALAVKAAASDVPVAVLRQVYCRGLASSDPIPPGLDRPRCALARVNTFLRLVSGDSSADASDSDLLSLLDKQ